MKKIDKLILIEERCGVCGGKKKKKSKKLFFGEEIKENLTNEICSCGKKMKSKKRKKV